MRLEGDRQLLRAREVGKVVQAEQLEEERRGAVQQRPAEALAAADDLDEPALLEVARATLEELGYTVLSAATPTNALAQATAHRGVIHLLLTDVVMPEMSGRDLAQHIQEIRPETKCLFMSGYTANVIAHRGVLDEGVHFLQKPFSTNALANKVREVLDAE